MSQEILFLLFMVFELAAILSLYQFVLIPRMAHAASIKTNNLFEERMLNKTWDIPTMLEDYTEHLAIVFSEIIKTLVPQVIGCLLYTSPSPRDRQKSRMPSSA